ncbi:hypothetical protein L1887_32111 [Cichorium endivia]|nr:hypothetical protein L1887_32111 [Cichorium endivia]
MSTLRTVCHLESSAISLPPLISRPGAVKLLNLHGANKRIQWWPRTKFGSFSVTLQPIPLRLTAVYSLMADIHSSDDAELKSVQRNFTEIVVGHLDIDLNDVGRQQAVAVAERLSRESKISAIYSSDLKRALKTAETIANKCGGLQGGGESLDQLYKRCTDSLQTIASKHRGERVVG